MSSIGSFWRLVVLPTLGFGALLGWTHADELVAMSASKAEPSAISSKAAEFDLAEWKVKLSSLVEKSQPTPPPRVKAARPIRHRDVQWPLR